MKRPDMGTKTLMRWRRPASRFQISPVGVNTETIEGGTNDRLFEISRGVQLGH